MAELIKTEHLSIEKLCFDHLDDFAAFAMDSSISYMVHCPMERKSDVISYVSKSMNMWKMVIPLYLDFAIVRDGKCIGIVTAYFDSFMSDLSIELSWLVRSEYRRQHVAAEAVDAVMLWLYNTYEASCFYACCDVRDVPSRRFCEKLGMILCDHGFNHGREEYKYKLSCSFLKKVTETD